VSPPTPIEPVPLAPVQWRARRYAHQARVDALLAATVARRRAGVPHPVQDFLFTYYSYRPAQLRRWHPGPDLALTGATAAEFGPGYATDRTGRLVLDAGAVLARRRDTVAWLHGLLTATAGRAPQLGCFGLHEWAMVYRLEPAAVRHRALPLRLGAAGTDAVLEGAAVRCGHVDAYRFFTPAARPRNLLRPTRERQAEFEQPGCLHANMDLYKWAYKLSPLVPSELVADCFELAREIRVLDMRASPYDLGALGLAPVPVETVPGRAAYARAQRDFAARAAPLRARLAGYCARLLATTGGGTPAA